MIWELAAAVALTVVGTVVGTFFFATLITLMKGGYK